MIKLDKQLVLNIGQNQNNSGLNNTFELVQIHFHWGINDYQGKKNFKFLIDLYKYIFF